MDISYKSIRSILKLTLGNHLQSSRFVIIMIVILVSFLGAIVKALWSSFPYALLVGVLNGAGIVAYIMKTMEPGAAERRSSRKE